MDQHDHDRMNDDGGIPPCVARERTAVRIGIAPSTEGTPWPSNITPGSRQPAEPLRLILPGDHHATADAPVIVSVDTAQDEPEPVRVLGALGQEVSSLTWPSYIAWRKTKCKPVDLASPLSVVEDLDQATHEFIGEVAEIGELFIGNGPRVFVDPDLRKRLVDEIGDAFFTGSWSLDAWGHNPLGDDEVDLELLRVTDENPLAKLARVISGNDPKVVLSHPGVVNAIGDVVFKGMLTAQSLAGLTANSFKKRKFQGRPQDHEAQVQRIIATLVILNQFLIVANSSVEEALQSNQRKLNARYPDGYQPGVGGGNRTGEGA